MPPKHRLHRPISDALVDAFRKQREGERTIYTAVQRMDASDSSGTWGLRNLSNAIADEVLAAIKGSLDSQASPAAPPPPVVAPSPGGGGVRESPLPDVNVTLAGDKLAGDPRATIKDAIKKRSRSRRSSKP